MKPLIITLNGDVRPIDMLREILYPRVPLDICQFTETFEWRALVDWKNRTEMRQRVRAYELICELACTKRLALLLGGAVRNAFDWAIRGMERGEHLPPVLVHPQHVSGVTFRQLPMPRLQNSWYANPDNVRVVELLLEELYNGARGISATLEVV